MAEATRQLIDMFPDVTNLDLHDCVLSDSEMASHRALTPNPAKCSDTPHLRNGQFRHPVFFTFGLFNKAKSYCVALIFKPSNPFEIIDSRVQLIAVFMVDFRFLYRVVNECFGNKAMDRCRTVVVVLPQGNAWIAIRVDLRSDVSDTPHPAKIGNFVKSVARNGTPFFVSCHTFQYTIPSLMGLY